MIDEHYITLIHQEIDGVISKSDREKLHNYLDINTEAQNFYHELCRTSELLTKIPKLEPSPNIKKYILNSIDANHYQLSRKPGIVKSLAPNLFTRRSVKLAYAFSLGILIGIFVHSIFLENLQIKDGIHGPDVSGTIGINGIRTFERIKLIPITGSEVNGAISVKRNEHLFMIEVDIRTQYTVELLMTYDETSLQFTDFDMRDHSKTHFESGGNNIRAFFYGDNQYSVNFNKISGESESVFLKLSTQGKIFYAQSIILRSDDKG
ncbi:hypothetical protein JXB12_05185 [candidate division KSB1 bacterium]|nr:hypothetical protein [candidate division KSB1 bacterium]